MSIQSQVLYVERFSKQGIRYASKGPWSHITMWRSFTLTLCGGLLHNTSYRCLDLFSFARFNNSLKLLTLLYDFYIALQSRFVQVVCGIIVEVVFNHLHIILDLLGVLMTSRHWQNVGQCLDNCYDYLVMQYSSFDFNLKSKDNVYSWDYYHENYISWLIYGS